MAKTGELVSAEQLLIKRSAGTGHVKAITEICLQRKQDMRISHQDMSVPHRVNMPRIANNYPCYCLSPSACLFTFCFGELSLSFSLKSWNIGFAEVQLLGIIEHPYIKWLPLFCSLPLFCLVFSCWSGNKNTTDFSFCLNSYGTVLKSLNFTITGDLSSSVA